VPSAALSVSLAAATPVAPVASSVAPPTVPQAAPLAADTLLLFADASSVHTRRWVAEMAQRGFDCVVATRRPAELPGAREVVALRPGADARGWFGALPEVRALARRVRPRWLHGHYVTSYGLWAAAASDAVPAPLVLTAWGSDILVTPRARGPRGWFMRRLVGRTLKRAALVTADAGDVLRAVHGYGTRAALEPVLWGADVERFRPGTPAEGFEIASLRAWEPNYRIPVLLQALQMLRAARPRADLCLHLLGGGPDEAALRAQVAALRLTGCVAFIGRVDDDGLIATLQRCRVSVSVPASDATSVSLLESMACGLPVVATDLPANRDWIDRDWRVPVDDPAALALALQRLLDDPPLAAAQGLRNRCVAELRASRRVHMDRMAALYRKLA
jgi:glycosyltransferase involved in cell wall biosynthesis